MTWEARDVTDALAEQGYKALVTEFEASRILARYGFVRCVTNQPHRAVLLSDVGYDLARRLNEKEARDEANRGAPPTS